MEKANVLSIRGLSKKYGRIQAVNQLDLDIPEGSVFGLLGPNGSGKSTTLGMVLGVVLPSQGTFEWLGKGSGHSIRRKIGAILEMPAFYRYLSAEANLKIVAKIKMVPNSRIHEVLRRVGLFERKDDVFSTFSLGMKQRLAIASALLPDPRVMILDEPTNGLDPEGIAEIRTLIQGLASDGRTIILASHLLDEVQKICTDFAVLKNGRKLYQGKVADLLQNNNRLTIGSIQNTELFSFLEKSKSVLKFHATNGGFQVELNEESDITAFHKAIIESGIVLNKLGMEENSLERKFLEILKSE